MIGGVGHRIDTAGNFLVKDTAVVGSTWTLEVAGIAKAIALSGTRIGVLETSGDFYIKDGSLTSSWTLEASGTASAIALSGTRVGMVDTSGNFLLKDGTLTGPWTLEVAGITSAIALSG